MRYVAVVLLLTTLAGCTSDDGGNGNPEEQSSNDPSSQDRPGYRDGVVFHNEPFSVTSVQAATFQVQVEEGAREVILEIQQDSGALPNLHVELSGCGEVDPPASAGWQAYPLCDAPEGGAQTLTISVGFGSPAGTGRALLRADLPD